MEIKCDFSDTPTGTDRSVYRGIRGGCNERAAVGQAHEYHPQGRRAAKRVGVVCVAASRQRNSSRSDEVKDDMGASKKPQMKTLDEHWPDKIWSAICEVNHGKGAAWKLAAAVLAVTGARPSELEKGITISAIKCNGKNGIEAVIQGSKLIKDFRGQPEHKFVWMSHTETHRSEELIALVKAVSEAPNRQLVVQYDAEAISTKLREISRKIWPRRKHHVTAYCYRELLSSTAKEADVPPEELAQAMGHLSSYSQNSYAHSGRKKRGGIKPWGCVTASVPVRTEKALLARFKAATVFKKLKLKSRKTL